MKEDVEDVYNILRKNIKKYRIEKNMTQAELAEKIGVSHDFIRQIESLKVSKNFSIQTLFSIAVALDTDMGKFFKP